MSAVGVKYISPNRLKNDASVDELRRLVAYCESALAVGLTAGVAN